MLILNEEQYAKNLYDGKITEVKSLMAKIRYVTRYLVHSEHKRDEDVYQDAVEWLQKYHDNFDESYYSNFIADAIKKAHKYPFYHVDNIAITQSELDKIASLNNLREEKVLFVLLCMAKQQAVSNRFTNGLVKYSITELCKMARISVPSDDREYILYEIVQKGLLGYPKKNNTQCLIVNFVDYESDVVLTIDEMDCAELAYKYLEWKNSGVGYGRCELCKRLMKKSKKNPQRFCERCSHEVGDISEGEKAIVCIDCGQLVCVSIHDSETCRCKDCNLVYQRERNARKNKAYRERHKSK